MKDKQLNLIVSKMDEWLCIWREQARFLTSFLKYDEPLYDLFLLFYVCRCFVYMHVFKCNTCVQCQRPQEGVGSSGTGATYADEPLCGCWESNSSSLEEQPVLSLNCSPIPLAPTANFKGEALIGYVLQFNLSTQLFFSLRFSHCRW